MIQNGTKKPINRHVSGILRYVKSRRKLYPNLVSSFSIELQDLVIWKKIHRLKKIDSDLHSLHLYLWAAEEAIII